jgi:hypothetical protein
MNNNKQRKNNMARKNTMKMVRALINGKQATSKNDKVKGGVWEYHENKIAYYHNGKLHVTLCDYGTVTTRERINQLLTSLGCGRVGFAQRKGKQVIVVDAKVCQEIDASDVYTFEELEAMV